METPVRSPAAPAGRPPARPQMHQRWRDLLFLHWRWPATDLQRQLPRGLTVDTRNGEAWIGVVAFRMEGVRLAGLPSILGASAFPELNLRTYVRDTHDRPGVWFFSLDAGNALAVWIARTFFHLPYFRADMHVRKDAEGFLWYESHRDRTPAKQEVRLKYRSVGEPAPAEKDSLAAFLAERYRLFAHHPRKGLFTGRVWHPPYPLQDAAVAEWDDHLFSLDGFGVPGRPPEHACFSAGVDVEIFGLQRCPPAR